MAEKSKTCAAATVELEPKLSSYEDFHPFAQLNTEEKDNNILTISLPACAHAGFEHQQIIVTKVRPSYKIRIQGERIIANNKRQQFNQSYKIPKNSNLNKIRAIWKNDVLTIIMPKEMINTQQDAVAKEEQDAVKKNNRGEGQTTIYMLMGALVGVAALLSAALGAYVSYVIVSRG